MLSRIICNGTAKVAFHALNQRLPQPDPPQRQPPACQPLHSPTAPTARAQAAGVPVRGYVSCAAGCPYSGAVDPRAAAAVARALWDMGCHEVSMGDTIGVATPAGVTAMFEVG
jgi:hypothetical protein